MSWRSLLFCVLVVVALFRARQDWMLRPVHPPDGVLVPLDPVQTKIDDAVTVTHGRWRLTEQAHYDITGRILSREDYSDNWSDLAPEDLALGWGPVSDNAVLKHYKISQGARFAEWQDLGSGPLGFKDFNGHFSNNHVIPIDERVRKQLAALRVGQVVHLTGELVDGVRDDGGYVKTSLSRYDTGAGACEIILVEEVSIE